MEKIKIDGKSYLSIDGFAEYKGKTRKTVYNWIDSNKVKTKRFLNRTFILIES